jgi:serine/threonine protein phosphatase PrpC
MKNIPTDPEILETESGEHPTIKREQSDDAQKMDKSGDFHFYGALRSNVGLVRERNEDSCFLFNSDSSIPTHSFPFALCLVADGMGGYEGGDRASKLAARTAARYLIQRIYLPALNGESPSNETQIVKLMGEAVLEAHESVHSPDYLGNGGTTLTIALVLGWQLYLAHVGDSRAYWLVDGDLELYWIKKIST